MHTTKQLPGVKAALDEVGDQLPQRVGKSMWCAYMHGRHAEAHRYMTEPERNDVHERCADLARFCANKFSVSAGDSRCSDVSGLHQILRDRTRLSMEPTL